jgi:hypothetical protein
MPDFPWLDAGLLAAGVAIITVFVVRRVRSRRDETGSNKRTQRSAERAKLSQREAEHQARGQRRQRLWLAVRDSGLQELPSRGLDDPLRSLQRLHEMLGEAQDWEKRLPGGEALEITGRAEQLYDMALGQVERAVNLHDLARTVPAGGGPLAQRLNELLADLNATIATLAAALDQLHASAVAGGFDPATRQRLRDDLDARLRIAAAVERRMNELE